MASVDVALKNSKFYNVVKFDVVNGEEGTIFLTPDKEGPTRWFWEHDKVLDTEVTDNQAKFKATSVGDSTLYVYDVPGSTARGSIIMQVDIKVVEAILEPAAKLVGTVGPAQPKRT
jgi:membrane carboxypeptidase/penicillin-binding protein PbpC